MIRQLKLEANELTVSGSRGMTKGGNTTTLANGTSAGDQFMNTLVNLLDNDYKVDPDEKAEAIQSVKEVLETVGMIPTIMYGIIEQTDGSQLPLVISQIHDPEVEKMIPMLFKPAISVSNNQSPTLYKDKTALVPVSKQIQLYDEKPKGRDDIKNIEEFLYDITGDNMYAEEVSEQIQKAMDGMKSTSGQAVTRPTRHQNVLNMAKNMNKGIEFKEDVISKLILKAARDNMLLPEYAEKFKANPKLKTMSLESRRRRTKQLIIGM